MRKRLLLGVIGTCLAVASASGAAAKGIDSGRIVVGRGIAGVTLGMTRAQVIARLGQPIYENRNGYMQYSQLALMDVYVREGRPKHVDLVTAAGRRFCLPTEICSLQQGGLARLLALYGPRLEVELYSEGDNPPDLVVRSRFHGRAVNTAFSYGRAQIVQVYIAFADPAEPVFGALPRSARARRLPLDAGFRSALHRAYCHEIVGPRACADRFFRGPLRGHRCLLVKRGAPAVCASYRLCHFAVAGSEWGVALFWRRISGAAATKTWFRRPAKGTWQAYGQLIVPRRLAAMFSSFGCPG
jgi:hypothetical protein